MSGLFKLTLHSYAQSDPFGNEFINVFGYRSSLPVLDELGELQAAFLAQVLPEVAACLSSDMLFTRLEIANVTNGVDYLDWTISPQVPGDRSGQSLPRFVAWGFKYQRATLGKRSGGKRFGKIIETDQDNGSPVVGFQPTLDACAVALGSPLTIGIIDTWFPEILERKPAGVYPWTSHSIAGVVFAAETTQNTRKR